MKIYQSDGVTVAREVDLLSASISQELNGEYSCEVVSLGEILADEVIELPDANGTTQPFRLSTPTQELETWRAKGWHISQDLAHELILNRGWQNKPAAQVWPELLQAGISERRFSGVSTVQTSRSLWVVRRPVLEVAMGQFIETYGGEIERSGWTLNHRPRIGENRGFEVRFAHNLLGVQIETDTTQIVNRVVPTFLSEAGGTALLPEKWVDSPRITATPFPHVQSVHYGDIQVAAKDGDGLVAYPTVASAEAEVRRRVEKLWEDGADRPAVSVSVDFVVLGNTDQHLGEEIEQLALGDDVRVIIGGMTFNERLVSYTWDCLEKEYTRAVLGHPRSTWSSIIRRIEDAYTEHGDKIFSSRTVPAITEARAALAAELARASGYYSTQIENPDGSIVVYYHDEPTLEASQVIEFRNAPGQWASTTSGWNDGSPVWQFGQTSTGNLIANVISAIGIEAEWINLDGGRTLAEMLGNIREPYFDYPLEGDYEVNSVLHLPGQTWSDLQGRGWTWGDIERFRLTWADLEGAGTYVASASGTGVLNMSDWELIARNISADFNTIARRVTDTEAGLTSAGLRVAATERLISQQGETIETTSQRLTQVEAGKISLAETTNAVSGTWRVNTNATWTPEKLRFDHSNGEWTEISAAGLMLGNASGVDRYLARVAILNFSGQGHDPVRLETPPLMRGKNFHVFVVGSDAGNAPNTSEFPQQQWRAGRSYYGLCPPARIPDGGPEYNDERTYVLAYQEWINPNNNIVDNGLSPATGKAIFLA